MKTWNTCFSWNWTINNQLLQWVLDLLFPEDASRARKDYAPEFFTILPHMALILLKQEKQAKGGVKVKRLLAGWVEDYLLRVLSG